jgi:hypothetical protein
MHGIILMENEIKTKKCRILPVIALVTGIMAVIFCVIYFLIWALFDDFLTIFIAYHGLMSYIMFSYVSAGVCLTVAAVITGSIDLKGINTGTYSSNGMGFDITGIILASLLILFGFMLWFLDFFGFINIIS